MIDTSIFKDNEIPKELFEGEEFISKLSEIISPLQETCSKEEVSEKISDVKDKIKDAVNNDELAEDIVDIVDTICSKKSLKKLLDMFGMKSLLAMGSLVNKELVQSMLGNIDGVLDGIESVILGHDGWNESPIE